MLCTCEFEPIRRCQAQYSSGIKRRNISTWNVCFRIAALLKITATTISMMPHVNALIRYTAHTKSMAQQYIHCPTLNSGIQNSIVLNKTILRNNQREFDNIMTSQRHMTILSNKKISDETINPKTNGRLGGRVFRQPEKKKSTEKKGLFQALKVWGRAILGFWAGIQILKLVLFGSFAGSNTVYYSSSYYESQTIDSKGQVQVNRKEEIRSNVPGLKNQIIKKKGSDDIRRTALPSTVLQGQRSFMDEFIPQQKQLIEVLEMMDQ